MKIYPIQEHELHGIGVLNNQTVVWSSIGGFAASQVASGLWDLCTANDLQVARAVTIAAAWLLVTGGSVVMGFRFQRQKRDWLEKIQSETKQ